MPKDAGHLTTAKVGEIAHRLLMTGDDKILAAATLRALAEERDRLREALAGEVLARAHDLSTGVVTFSCYLCETLDTIGADGSGHKDDCLVAGMAFDAALGE